MLEIRDKFDMTERNNLAQVKLPAEEATSSEEEQCNITKIIWRQGEGIR